MLIKDILQQSQPSFSFEFFPPKTEAGWDSLFQTISDLTPLQPDSVSVTYGAGGSTRDLTHKLVTRITRETDVTVVAHLTCIGSTRDEIEAILQRYDDAGVHNILALRGDPPKGQTEWTATAGGFTFAADLVAFIKQKFPHFGIGVAGFPEGHCATPNRLQEIEHLKAKMDAGADYICTQLFFDNHDFYDFRDRCRLAGMEQPIIAGLMPVTSRQGMMRMADLAAGAHIPAPLLKSVLNCVNDHAVEKTGTHWLTEQVRDLINHEVDGIHFYTLNKSETTRKVFETLTLTEV
ncbi:MAG: methylenetetrahydrofolate reductase [NAD(P)H] [Verrucomicrobiota bacterium]